LTITRYQYFKWQWIFYSLRNVFFSLSLPRFQPDLTVYLRNTPGVLLEAEFTVANLFSYLCCPIKLLYILSSMLWCPLRFPHKDNVWFVFPSSCLEKGSCLIYIICVCLHIVVSNTYCVVFFFILSISLFLLPVSLDCPFLIAPSVFSNVYLHYICCSRPLGIL
jgi:hypothetical protein